MHPFTRQWPAGRGVEGGGGRVGEGRGGMGRGRHACIPGYRDRVAFTHLREREHTLQAGGLCKF